MYVISLTVIFFLVAFLLHFIIWRIRIPKRQTLALLKIFYGIFIAGLIVLGVDVSNIITISHIFVIYSSLVAAYIITYSAIEADSPSLVIINTIYETGKKGLPKDELYSLMGDDLLVLPRLDDLARDNLALLRDGKYVITQQGRIFVGIFIAFRRFLSLPKGG